MTTMTIEILSADAARDWDEYVERHPGSTCYHLRAWKGIAERAYRIHSPFLLARRSPSGPVTGVLPLYCIRGRVQGHVTNGLFGAYGDVLGDTEKEKLELVREAKRVFEREGSRFMMLKCVGDVPFAAAESLEEADSWVIATLRLERDPEKMWHGLRDKIRNCVRKAERHGLKLRVGPECLDGFYDVLAENMHQKGAPIYGRQFMRELIRGMGDRAEVLTLSKGEQVVSGALTIRHHKTAYVPFASSRPSSLHMSPNNLLYWEIIRRGCVSGLEVLDFGRSLKNSGPLAFKQGWGASVIPQQTYVCSAKGRTLRVDPKDRKVDWFVRQWKRLPRPVADALGPAVCRRLAGLI